MNRYITLAIACFAVIPMQAQTIDDVLRQVEQNNKELQAQAQATLASKLEVQAENNLEDPSVEYSPFYTRGITGTGVIRRCAATSSSKPRTSAST